MALVDELYDGEDAERIKAMHQDGESSRYVLMQAIGSKIIESEKILVSSSLDIIMMICAGANFADSDEECAKVAMIVQRNIRNDNPLPYLMDGQTLQFAERTLIALTFFTPAIQHRHTRNGAPPPEFYRDVSKAIFTKYDHEDVAVNHERWEAFLSEMFSL